MQTAIQALTVVLPVGYLALAGLASAQLRTGELAEVGRAQLWCRALVLLSHVALFVLYGVAGGGFPLLSGWPGLSAVALSVALLYLLIERNARHAGTADVVFGFVFALQLGASAFGPTGPLTTARSDSPVLMLHTLTSLAACAPLVLSGIHGALYLVLYRSMRRREISGLSNRLPDLSLLARMTRRSALVGFILLTVSVNMGIWWGHASEVAGFGYDDPFVLVMLAIWLHFGVVSFSRRIPGLTAKHASMAATGGLLVLVATLLFSLSSHTFHWSA